MDEIVDDRLGEKARRLPPTRCNDGSFLPLLPTNADDIVGPAADADETSTSSK